MTIILYTLATIGGLSLLALTIALCIFARALSRMGRDLDRDAQEDTRK